jgi:hypothetical protein
MGMGDNYSLALLGVFFFFEKLETRELEIRTVFIFIAKNSKLLSNSRRYQYRAHQYQSRS